MGAGRPRIYTDVDELSAMVDSYFMRPKKIDVSTKEGNIQIDSTEIEPITKPTVTGLALHLGFADKTTLYEYRDRPELSYPIKRALTIIEKYHEEGLSENNVAGRIFALKNMGWKDKHETELSGGLEVKQITGMVVT